MIRNTVPLNKADLAELSEWADDVCKAAGEWAERAEVSRGDRKELTSALDALMHSARRVASNAAVLNAR